MTGRSADIDEARAWLKNLWRNHHGDVQCPECGSPAQDWEVIMDILILRCEDCNEEAWRYYN